MGATWWKKHFNHPVEKIIPNRLQRKLTPHSFRHGLNTNLLIAGCDPLLVQKYLGWSNNYIKMLVPVQAGYTHIQVAPLEKVVQMIDEIYT